MSESVTWLAEGVEGADSRDRRRHVRRAYVVATAAKDSVSVLSVSGVPALGAAHPGLAGAVAVERSPRSLGNGYEWEVDVAYEFTAPAARPKTPTSPTAPEEVPTDEPWEISQDYQEVETVATALAETAEPGGSLGTAANPSVNTAGDAFADPVTEPVWCQVLALEKNLASGAISPSTAESYQGSVNTAAITVAGVSIGVRCGWMRRCAVQKRYYGDAPTSYWRLRVEIVVYPSSITTDIPVLQVGYNQLVSAAPKPIYGADGEPLRVPSLLAADGTVTTTPYWRYFARSKRVAWSGLSLPTTA
jgi:hypothetical protein